MSRVTVYDVRSGKKIMEESGPNSPPPVMPSIGDTAGIKAQNNLNETTARMGAFAVMACCLDAALELIEKLGGESSLSLDTFRTDNRQPASIIKVGNQYMVSRKKPGT